MPNAPRDDKTYTNPIIDRMGLADPSVIRYEGKYYLYPTSDSKGYEAYVSDDLVHWENKGYVYTSPRAGLWATDVFHNKKGDGKFYLYYTDDTPDSPRRHAQADWRGGGRRTARAVPGSRSIVPGRDQRAPVPGRRRLTLSVLLQLGRPRLHRGCAHDRSAHAEGSPQCLIRATEEWEKRGGAVTEGPWMLEHKGVFYLMYSGSPTDLPDYAVGYATSKSPLGPYTKYAGNPVVKRGGSVLAPGHHCVAEGPDGRLWIVYHQKKTERRAYDRFLAIDPLWFDDQGVIHTKLSRGTPEPAP